MEMPVGQARPIHVEHHTVDTPDGWGLTLHRGTRAGHVAGPPVLFVPGFGMNSYIFRFHPRGTSFMEVLLDAGLDPWAVDLRGHSTTSPRAGASRSIGLADYAYTDLPTAFDHVHEVTGYPKVHAIGCSLGGALLYAYGSTIPSHRIDRLVTMGTPLRWTSASRIVRAFGQLTPLMGFTQPRGTRHLARVALPVVSRFAPGLLSIYLNPKLTDTSPSRALSRTVENPHRRVNKQLGRWIQRTDLKIGGIQITEALRSFDRPLLVVAGGGDKICLPENALAALEMVRGPAEALVVGQRDERVSHADLFISDIAPTRIFTPIHRWLNHHA